MTRDDRIQFTRRCCDLYIVLADKLAETGVHPISIIEGGFGAMIQLNKQVTGDAAIVAWLRDAADHIEADLLATMPKSVFGNPPGADEE
jgi:hypothetical protein